MFLACMDLSARFWSQDTVPLRELGRWMKIYLYIAAAAIKIDPCLHNYNTISILPPFRHPTHPRRGGGDGGGWGGITWLSLPLSYHMNIFLSPKSWPQLVRSHPIYWGPLGECIQIFESGGRLFSCDNSHLSHHYKNRGWRCEKFKFS